MNNLRRRSAITSLGNGKILITGGYNDGVLASVELYDPVTDTWLPTAPMNNRRYECMATLLSDGKVLVTGGHNLVSNITTNEIYDPISNSWKLQ